MYLSINSGQVRVYVAVQAAAHPDLQFFPAKTCWEQQSADQNHTCCVDIWQRCKAGPMVDKFMLKCTLWHRSCLAFSLSYPVLHSPSEYWQVIPELVSRIFLQASKCRRTINLVSSLFGDTLQQLRLRSPPMQMKCSANKWVPSKCPLIPLDSQGGIKVVQDLFAEHSKCLGLVFSLIRLILG